MEKSRELLASAEFGKIACLFTWRAPRHLVAAGILSGMILMTPAGASAQFNDVLRNVMQNMLQVPQPANRAYPPLRQPAYPYGACVPAPAVSDPGTIADIQRMLDDLGYNAGLADGTSGTAKRASAQQLWARPRFAEERSLGRIAQRGAQRMVRAQSRAWIRAGRCGPRHFPTEL